MGYRAPNYLDMIGTNYFDISCAIGTTIGNYLYTEENYLDIEKRTSDNSYSYNICIWWVGLRLLYQQLPKMRG